MEYLQTILSGKPFFFISERFISRFMVLLMNERDVLNKWQQQATCEVCMYNFANGAKFLRELFLQIVKNPAKIAKKFVPHGRISPTTVKDFPRYWVLFLIFSASTPS